MQSLANAAERIALEMAKAHIATLRLEFDKNGRVDTANLPADLALLFKMAEAPPGFDMRPMIQELVGAAGFQGYEFPCVQTSKAVARNAVALELESRAQRLEQSAIPEEMLVAMRKRLENQSRAAQEESITNYKSTMTNALLLNKLRACAYPIVGAAAVNYANFSAEDAIRKMGIAIVSEFVAGVLHQDGIEWVENFQVKRDEYFRLKESLPTDGRFSTEEGKQLLLDIVRAKLDEVKESQKQANAPLSVFAVDHILMIGAFNYIMLFV